MESKTQYNHIKKQLTLSPREKIILLIQVLFRQMTKGCGDKNCKNEWCIEGNETLKSKTKLEIATKAKEIALGYFIQGGEGEEEKDETKDMCKKWNPLLPTLSELKYTGIQWEAINALKNTKVATSYLEKLIRFIFRSTDNLTQCFLTHTSIEEQKEKWKQSLTSGMTITKQHQEEEEGYSVAGIDINQVNEFYKYIFIMKNKDGSDLSTDERDIKNKLKETLLDALKELLMTIKNESASYGDPVILRMYIILLLCTQWNEHEMMAGKMFLELLKSLFHLNSTLRNKLSTLLARIENDLFKQMLERLQQFITLRIFTNYVIDEHIFHAVDTMDLMNKANNQRQYPRPYQEFYNDAINDDLVNMKDEVVQWKRSITQFGQQNNINGIQQHENAFRNYKHFSLINYPFILDPTSKTKVLRYDATIQQHDQIRNMLLTQVFSRTREPTILKLVVRREHLIEDTMNQIQKNEKYLKNPLQVVFSGEEGVDQGGLRKEFFLMILRKLIDPAYAMFTYNHKSQTFWFSSNNSDIYNFKLIGTIIGLGLYNKVILDIHFPMVLYKRLCGIEPTLEDMKDHDPDYYKGLKYLLEAEGDIEDDFGLTFSIEKENFGKIETIDLIEDGSNVPITAYNRKDYVDAVIRYKYVTSIQHQFDAFYKGFNDVIGGAAIQLFRPEELELLVCGSPVWDFDALEKNTKYGEGYSKNHPVIKNFWRVVKSFDDEHKKHFLAFCTGSDRVPIRGLGQLIFVIVKNGTEDHRLPTAHTCFNHLLLPEYSTEEVLKERLTTAISNYEGFGMK